MIYLFISSLNWQFKGPDGGDFLWVSGRGCRILISNLYVIYTSSNCGSSWSNTNISNYAPLSVIVGQTRGNVFGHTEYYNTSNYTNWTTLSYPFNAYNYTIGNISDRASDTIFIAADSSSVAKIYRSIDGGLNWQLVSTFNNVSSYVINFRGNHVYYVFYDNTSQSFKIAYSSNLGSSWTIRNSNGLSLSLAFDLDIDPSNPNHVIVLGLNSNSGFFGLFESNNGGNDFSVINNISSGVLFSFDIEFYNSNTIYISSLAFAGIIRGQYNGTTWNFTRVFNQEASSSISIDGSNIYSAILGQGFVFSNDAGNTWNIRNNGLVGHLTPNDINIIVYPPYKSFISNSRSNKLMFINGGGNVFVSDNNNNLIPCSNEFEFGSSVEFAPFSENTILVSGAKLTGFINIENLKRSSNGCSGPYTTLYSPNVILVPGAQDSLVADIQINSNPNNVFMVSNSRILYYSNNGGSTRNVIRNSQYPYFCYSCMDTLFYVDYDSLFVSYNGGQSWSLLLTDNFLTGAFHIEYYRPYVIVVASGNLYKYYNITNLNDSARVSVSQFSYIVDIGITRSGRIFIIGYNNAYVPIIAMISLDGSVQHISNLPGSGFAGHIKVLNNYIWYYDRVGFWVADWTVSEREWEKDISLEYTRNGILFKNYDGSIRIYDIQGRFLFKISGNFLSYSNLKRGIYVVKTDVGTFKIFVK
ncbi:MAG: hypothetical protein RMJ38_06240 [candidate division WOR-3 bacterium]|nr:hypothetical protein [candidate division WOR-3 bacterium]MDW8151022.1 hypothetical protein [candidate division WOR-3 bacterium]